MWDIRSEKELCGIYRVVCDCQCQGTMRPPLIGPQITTWKSTYRGLDNEIREKTREPASRYPGILGSTKHTCDRARTHDHVAKKYALDENYKAAEASTRISLVRD